MAWHKSNFFKVIEQIPIGVAVTLPEGAVVYANPHLCRLLAAGAEALPLASLFKLRGQEATGLEVEIRRHLKLEGFWHGETEFLPLGGSPFHVLESIFPLQDERGTTTHFIHFLQDMSAHKHAKMLNSLAFYDSLTGLPNRNLLQDRLARAMATSLRNDTGFAVLYIDIDRFKQVNDSHGHDFGDELLRQFAARLQRGLRNIDTVARLGGDEFVAILEDITDAQAAVKVVEKLLGACRGEYELCDRRLRVTLSIGIGIYPDDALDTQALLRCADTAMYRAKTAGRDRYVLSASAGCCGLV